MEEPGPLRISNIDVLRGIAAVMVMLFHLTGSTTVHLNWLSALTKFGFLGVQIFFIISGFILPYSMVKAGYKPQNFLKFIVSRVIRIYPAFIVSIIIGVGIAILTHRNIFPYRDILMNLILVKDSISPVFWTLSVEFQFYLLIGLIPYLFNPNNIATIILIAITITSSILLPHHHLIFNWLPFFATGILTFNNRRQQLPLKFYIPLLVVLLGWITYQQGLIFSVISAITVLVLHTSIKENAPFGKLMIWLGTISYSLYLTHWELGRAAVSVSRRLPYIGSNDLFRLAMGIAFSIFTGWLLYRLIEKPALMLSKRYKNAKS